jgi:KUP system potassium uptake protein
LTPFGASALLAALVTRMVGGPTSAPPGSSDRRLPALALAALGVVFGDIGTSPLYAFNVCFARDSGLAPTVDNVLGVLSLVLWSLIIVVSVKYVVFVMRADLKGEGGILALMTLATSGGEQTPRRRSVLIALGLFGAALLYGDGMLTPAISVLSAVEGLKVATPMFVPAVQFIAVAVLVLLFSFQQRGTGTVGAVFGPVMLLWFLAIVLLGLRWIALAPEVLASASPQYAVRFLVHGGLTGYLILGSVFLVVTGGEALYADIGHFGTRPIRLMWFAVVLPGVLINYFGQGALLLRRPDGVHHTFYSMAPEWALYPLVGLATAAAVIASQAIIAGAFSLTAQALELGYSPRVEVRHSSEDEEGQVYVPLINWLLLLAAVGLVVHFRTSDALAGAYGVAVSGTMVLTTILAFVYFRRIWGLLPAAALAMLFLPIDLAFVGANLVKIDRGGGFPLFVAACGYLLFTTWMRGQQLVTAEQSRVLESEFLQRVTARPPLRVPGTAVFLTRAPAGVPRTLLHNLAHNHVLHEQVVLLTLVTDPLPRVSRTDRLAVQRDAAGMVGIVARYGYMQHPNVPQVLREATAQGFVFDPSATTYFLARVRVVVTRRPGMARWRKRLYALLAANALSASANYRIPSEQVFEVGVQVEL